MSTGYNAENRLTTIAAIFDTSWYGTLLGSFTQKYGTPKLSKTPWQTRSGSIFENDVATWTFSDGTLTLERLGGDLDNGSFVFEAPANLPPADAPTVDF